MIYTTLSLIFLMIGAVVCSSEQVQLEDHGQAMGDTISDAMSDNERFAPLEKRSPHYNFGLGKRAYSYVSEYKRLPVYNFGLGKRSKPYSFGLGKRSIDDDSQPEEDVVGDIDQETLAELLDHYDEGYGMKRARPYSFGLGKRTEEDIAEEKRQRMYDFGLGKRVPLYNFGLGKRAKSYNFGLGKRLSKFNFGLGKRERDMHRFSFGLGKRSDESMTENDAIGS